ncbi:MAG: hypothetical protein Q9M18_01745, partial [Mariprofundaceae bacterium]|nr:hypothetical protein [Mariprofundaceae bacterium]
MSHTLPKEQNQPSVPSCLRGHKVALVAITKHGAAQAAELAPKLAEVDIITSMKFAHVFSHL